jgi:hypothetical protein
MSFLQPALLAALPLVALPIIIHLINQRRYQTIRWAAMMFLLAANRMSRGYARIRQWLIMAFRMAAIAGLVFAVSRPLSGGWLGMAAGGRPDTTIVLVDRSPSMQQRGGGAGASKLETGLTQLARTLETFGSSRWVLIDSATAAPRELDSAADLVTSTSSAPVSAAADLPAMLQAAHDYIKANKAGRTEVWICSDLRENDWNPSSGRWESLREAFRGFPQAVRFHLLAYPQPAPANLSVRVTEARRQDTSDGAELVLTLKMVREGKADERQSVPIQFEIEGARSVATIEMAGPQYELRDHRIPLERGRARGWGRVAIPADRNPADNAYWFAFDRPGKRHAVIVADDSEAARPLELSAAIAPEAGVECSAEVVGVDQLAAVAWEKVALLLWQAPLPAGDAAEAVRRFVGRGGRVIFFPPREPDGREFQGVCWTAWVKDARGVDVESWRGDQDLLAQTQSGAPLPVGKLLVRGYCGLKRETTPLATLKGGAPLLARAASDRGGVYFCATTPAMADSSLAADGVVLYVLIQRALAQGAAELSRTRQLTAGEASGEDAGRWERLAGAEGAVSTEYPLQAGVYTSGDRLLAVNRPLAEDAAPVLADRRVAGLFRGLDFSRVDDRAGNAGSLVQEVWRLFLVAMMVSLLVEAGLCLPRAGRPAGAVA